MKSFTAIQKVQYCQKLCGIGSGVGSAKLAIASTTKVGMYELLKAFLVEDFLCGRDGCLSPPGTSDHAAC